MSAAGQTPGNSFGRDGGSFGEQPKPRVSKCKRKIVKTLSPTLGIAGEKPQHSEDL